MPVRTAREALRFEIGNRLVASTWLAAEIICTDGNNVLCAYITICVCVSGNLYPYHHNNILVLVAVKNAKFHLIYAISLLLT
jgi:hypothetical protein